MKAPLVSVLIPAFNAQEWIGDTLRSAIAQTWGPKEIIVVDDGSTDRTLEVVHRIGAKSVHVVKQTNQGAAAARNKAFALSHGEYIQWLDADDLLAPDKIAKQLQALGQFRSRRILLSSAWGRFRYRLNRASFVPTALWCDLSPTEWLFKKMEQNLYMQTATWLVSRELTEISGPWDIRLLGDDDNEYFCRVVLASKGVRFVPDAKVYYRSFGYGSLSYVGLSDKKLEAHWLSMHSQIRRLQAVDDTERSRAACVKYLQNWLHYFYPQRLDIVRMAEQLARSLGGRLDVPQLSWKYSWMQRLFGWGVARRGQDFLRKARRRLEKLFDKILFFVVPRSRVDVK